MKSSFQNGNSVDHGSRMPVATWLKTDRMKLEFPADSKTLTAPKRASAEALESFTAGIGPRLALLPGVTKKISEKG